MFPVEEKIGEIAAALAEASELDEGFGKVGRLAHGVEEAFLGLGEIAEGEHGHAEIIMVYGALRILGDLFLKVVDVLIDIGVAVFHAVFLYVDARPRGQLAHRYVARSACQGMSARQEAFFNEKLMIPCGEFIGAKEFVLLVDNADGCLKSPLVECFTGIVFTGEL